MGVITAGNTLPTMTAISDFQTAMASAVSYVTDGDYDNARRYLIIARMHLAQVPNSSADGVSAQWREDLAALESSINLESGRSTRCVTVDSEFAR